MMLFSVLLTEPAAAASAWTPELIKSLFDGLAVMFGALGTLIGVMVWAVLQIRTSRKEGQQVGAVRDGKLDTLVTQSDTIVAQGNGAMAAALARIATLEAVNAQLSGRVADHVRAAGADAEVEVHAAQVKEVVKAAVVAQLPTAFDKPQEPKVAAVPIVAAGPKPAEEK